MIPILRSFVGRSSSCVQVYFSSTQYAHTIGWAMTLDRVSARSPHKSGIELPSNRKVGCGNIIFRYLCRFIVLESEQSFKNFGLLLSIFIIAPHHHFARSEFELNGVNRRPRCCSYL